jgi:hypothetical protein
VSAEPCDASPPETLADAALRLTRDNRLPVFPCGKHKKPFTKHGFKDATTDEGQVRRWWTRFPDALIGVPTGSGSGLLAIDVDPAGIDFVLQRGDILDTARQHNTPRGFHYLFRTPADLSIGCSAGKLAEGVDVRCDGGYIIWWPAAGLDAFGPEIDKLPLPPDSLIGLLAKSSNVKPSSRNAPPCGELFIPEPRMGLRFADVALLLAPIDPDLSYDNWSKVLMAVHHETAGSEAGFELVNEWSAKGKKYDGVEDVRSHWRSFNTDRPNIVGAAWLKKFSAEQFAFHASTSDDGARFAVIQDHQFVERDPLTWHIKGVLPKAELAVAFGPSGSGKSFFVFDIAAAISAGMPWQGRKTTKGKVVFVLAEGAMGFRNRLLAYAKTHAGSFPGVRIIDTAPNLLGEQDHVLLAQQIEASGGADLIIIDTLAASSPGADENAAKDMGRVIEHCKRLHKTTGATLLLIHHSGKDESRGARGWSGLRAAADAEIEVNRSGDQRIATVTKLKDGEDGAKFGFKLVPVEIGIDADGDPVKSCIVEPLDVTPPGSSKEPRPRTIERALLDAIRDDLSIDGPVSISSVVETCVSQIPQPKKGRDTRRQHVSRALRALAAKGLIAIEGEQCRSL